MFGVQESGFRVWDLGRRFATEGSLALRSATVELHTQGP